MDSNNNSASRVYDGTATDTWQKKPAPDRETPALNTANKLDTIIDKLDEIISILNDMALYEEMKSWL